MTTDHRIHRFSIPAVLAVIALLAVGVAGAAPCESAGRHQACGRPGEVFGGGPSPERLAHRLDLNEEQVTAVTEIHQKGQARDVELRKQMARLRNEMHGEMLKDEPSEKTVMSLTGRLGELQTKLRENRLRDRLAVRKLLTPEQRDKMLTQKNRIGRRFADRDGACGERRSARGEARRRLPRER